MVSRNEAREHEARSNPYHKKQEICCIVSRPLSLFLGSVSLHATIVRSGMTNRSVKDCRVGRKSCALLAMTNLVGFAGKRGIFRNETFENGAISGTERLKNGAEQHRAKNDRIKQKTSVFQTKTFQFCVIARSAATWQSLSDRRGIPWRSTGVGNKTAALSQKT